MSNVSQNMRSLAQAISLYLSALFVSVAATHKMVNDWETINRLSGVAKHLHEGDLNLSEEQRDYLDARKGVNFESFPSYKWPNVNGYPFVPFRLDSSLTSASLSAITSAIVHWMQSTCIVFNKTTKANQPHLLFTKLSGCWSSLGRISKMNGQNISIGAGCEQVGIAAHEIGHALGFFHEQSRDDRDDYVIINFRNIPSDYVDNFRKVLSAYQNAFSVLYDLSSDMHYGSTYFTSNGKLTVITKDPLNQGLIGKRTGLSHRDKRLANLMYGCIDIWLAKCGVTVDPCQNEGYFGVNCTCVCRPGTTGSYCEIVTSDYYAAIRSPCNQVETSPGLISSPGYPTNYSRGLECVYVITAPVRCRVKLQFVAFNLYPPTTFCQFDLLELRLTGTFNGDVYCGTQIAAGKTFTSKRNQAVLYFSTKASGYGWQANATFICAGSGK